MNKAKDIQEGNKLIMFFDGANESMIEILGKSYHAIKYKDSYYPYWNLPKFNEDWNLLMPVVEKIWCLGGWEYCIFANGCTINGDHEQPPYISHTEGDTIKSTWLAVTDFITWYNQNKTS